MDRIKSVPTREEMYELIPKGGVGAELGVCKGSNAVQLYFRTKPRKLFLVDTWDEVTQESGLKDHQWPDLWYGDSEEEVKDLFKAEIEEGFVCIKKQNTIEFLGLEIKDSSLDWVYLDSDHAYEYFSVELDESIKKVKSGGYIMGHDFEVANYAHRDSVVRAVIERIQNGDLKIEAITLEKWPSYLARVL